MCTTKWLPLLGIFVCVAIGCEKPSSTSQRLTPERAAAVENDVRSYVAQVAHDVGREGPAAWRQHFSDSPAFFMASEGRLQFPDSASATAAIQELARTIKHIELQWGDLRVDPLASDLAIVGAPYREIREDNAGNHVDERGYFTGTVEYRNGRWTFRNAHWSVVGPPPAVR
jgi:hypothetical protein